MATQVKELESKLAKANGYNRLEEEVQQVVIQTKRLMLPIGAKLNLLILQSRRIGKTDIGAQLVIMVARAYVTHKECDHWKFYNKDGTHMKNVFPTKETGSSNTATNKKMSLSDNLKAAMVTKFKCSDADAQKL